MSEITWSNEYSVNVEEIDNQHKKLFKMINILHEAAVAKQSKDLLADLFNDLSDFCDSHFGMEENYFAQFQYPEAKKHISEHKVFRRRVEEFKNEFEAGEGLLSLRVSIFLNTWLKKHILGTDKKYVQCFHENGLK